MQWILPFLATSAMAADSWIEVTHRDGCTYYVGEKNDSALVPVRASCDWPLSATKLQHLLSQFDNHHLYFELLELSNVLSTDGDGSLVYQLHRLMGMPDREVVVRMWAAA